MKKGDADDSFFDYMNFAVPWIEDAQEKIEFLECYFRDILKINDIENSFLVLGKMRSKTFLYLIMTILVEYDYQRKSHKKLSDDEHNDPSLYYLHVGKVDPSKLQLQGKDLNIWKDDLEDVGVDLGQNSLIIFTFDRTQSTLRYVKKVIDDLESHNGSWESDSTGA